VCLGKEHSIVHIVTRKHNEKNEQRLSALGLNLRKRSSHYCPLGTRETNRERSLKSP
jgi:hypothetical protein